MGTISCLEYWVSPKYRKNPFNGLFGWILEKNRVPSVEELQEKYAFTYYSTMNKAVTDVNNGAIGASADVRSLRKSSVADIVSGVSKVCPGAPPLFMQYLSKHWARRRRESCWVNHIQAQGFFTADSSAEES